jgi:hypothetical protein
MLAPYLGRPLFFLTATYAYEKIKIARHSKRKAKALDDGGEK